jgi:predicted alpha/beta hydrolase
MGVPLARASNSTDGTTVRDWANWMPQIGIDFLEAVMLSARQTTQQVPPVL